MSDEKDNKNVKNERTLLDKNVKIRKQNMKIYSIYRAISMDILFFYAIDFLFLTQVKNISASDVILKSSFYALFMIVLQIPANILIDRIGLKKSTVLGNIFNVTYLLVIIFAKDLKTLIIAEFFSALCFSIKDISDTTLLNNSIPNVDKKGEIFSKIEGKGNKNYFYLNAVTSILAGVVYTINPYIPIIVAIVITTIATVLSLGFQDIPISDEVIKNNKYNINKYIIDLKDSFKFIIKSNRLRSLLLYSGIMWGFFCLASTYRTSLLDDIGISSTLIAIVTAITGISSGIGSKKQIQFHKKFRNKTLSVISIITAIMIVLSGIAGIINFSPNIIMIFVLAFYIMININKQCFWCIND